MSHPTHNDLPLLVSKAEPRWLSVLKKHKKHIEKMDCEIHAIHDEVVGKTDCLSCANCCRTLGPHILDSDIQRMAKALRMKPSEVATTYLRIDEDGDYVFQTMPCPFLMPDNYCLIYENRPKACREYPHTDRKKFHQIFKLSIKNAQTCPIAYEVVKRVCDGFSK